MKIIVNIVIAFFWLSNYCSGQSFTPKNDSIVITLNYTKHQLHKYRIPIFINKCFSYTYTISNDSLLIKILPTIDTLFVKNDKYVFFDNISTKSKSQLIKIPIAQIENVRYLLIGSKYMKTYLFRKRRKVKNHFSLKYIY